MGAASTTGAHATQIGTKTCLKDRGQLVQKHFLKRIVVCALVVNVVLVVLVCAGGIFLLVLTLLFTLLFEFLVSTSWPCSAYSKAGREC